MAEFAHGMTSRRGVLKGAAAAGGSLLLPAGARAQATPRRGGTLRVAMPYNLAALDPMTGRNASDFNVLYILFDNLIDYDVNTLELKPGLAKAWKYADAQTLVLDLQEGVTFHDGTPFDAEAVKFNLDRYKNDKRSNAKADMQTVDAVEITGPMQVTVRLNKPNVALVNIMTDRIGVMVSPTSIRSAPDGNVDIKPVGTGPFKLVSWSDNDRLVATRNDNYWRKGTPYLDGIDMHIINDAPTALRSVSAGENDIVLNSLSLLKPIADKDPNLVAVISPSMVQFGCFLNIAVPPLDDLRVRQAINYAVDRDELVQVGSGGLDDPGCAIFPKEHWACDPATLHYYTHDLDKAKTLMADAGHGAGILEINAVGWSDQLSVRRHEALAAQLEKIGIKLNYQGTSPADAVGMFFTKHLDSAFESPVSARPDPSQQYDNLFSKGAFYNAGGGELPGYRDLLDATFAATDHEARQAALFKLQRFEIENSLMFTWYLAKGFAVHNRKVHGYANGLLGKPKLASVWMDA